METDSYPLFKRQQVAAMRACITCGWACACMRACVRACVRVCVRVRARVCVFTYLSISIYIYARRGCPSHSGERAPSSERRQTFGRIGPLGSVR